MGIAVNNQSLFYVALLVLIALFIAWREKLGLDRDMIIAVIRAVIQLVIVGYVLRYIIQLDQLWVTLIIATLIIFNASYNAMKRSALKSFKISLAAIGIGTIITLSGLILAGAIKLVPFQIIPITGMIASNAMIAVGLCFKTMDQAFKDQRQQVIEKLTLGADLKDATLPIIRMSIKTAMQPTIDGAKTVGIVSLPGMMSGLIFAGIDPVRAIKYQIMVTFMLISTASIASFIAAYLGYRKYFNTRKQLKSMN